MVLSPTYPGILLLSDSLVQIEKYGILVHCLTAIRSLLVPLELLQVVNRQVVIARLPELLAEFRTVFATEIATCAEISVVSPLLVEAFGKQLLDITLSVGYFYFEFVFVRWWRLCLVRRNASDFVSDDLIDVFERKFWHGLLCGWVRALPLFLLQHVPARRAKVQVVQ